MSEGAAAQHHASAARGLALLAPRPLSGTLYGTDTTVAQEYLARLSTLVGRLGSASTMGVKLECKHFFSGAAVYARGKICMSWTPVGFAIKLPEASRNILLKQPGAQLLRYFPQGPIKKDYVVLPELLLEDMKGLRRWAKVGVAYALLPDAPKAKAKRHITRRSTRPRAKAARAS